MEASAPSIAAKMALLVSAYRTIRSRLPYPLARYCTVIPPPVLEVRVTVSVSMLLLPVQISVRLSQLCARRRTLWSPVADRDV